MSGDLAFTDATPEHFPAILSIEREAGDGSLVVLTNGHALTEALERGHHVIVALDGGEVAGWIWFSIDGSRGGEDVGHLHRVAVATEHTRIGIGRALVSYAQALLAARGCTRLRVTLAADDETARAFFASAGYRVDAMIVERAL